MVALDQAAHDDILPTVRSHGEEASCDHMELFLVLITTFYGSSKKGSTEVEAFQRKGEVVCIPFHLGVRQGKIKPFELYSTGK